MTKAGLRNLAILLGIALLSSAVANAQDAAPLLTPDQLDTLVAPVALYPDSLLGQVLVASTYPLEIAEADQWLQSHGGLQGEALVEAGRQENWDPSIQALIAFPDVIRRLASDVRWTTDLGNAFLAQQADVMQAVQDMRSRARDSGHLQSTAQEIVTTETDGDRTAIDIQPADPQVVYVPTYNPEYIWGPPAYGYYPELVYPAFGFGFCPAVFPGRFFVGIGWGGWGWGLNWFHASVFENGFFFHRFGYRGGRGDFEGRRAWAHDPGHRLGVPYPHGVSAGSFRAAGAGESGTRSFGGRGFATSSSFRGDAGTRANLQARPDLSRTARPSPSFPQAGTQTRAYRAPQGTAPDFRGTARPSPSFPQAGTQTRAYRAPQGAAPGFHRSAPPSFQAGGSGRGSTPYNASRPWTASRPSTPQNASRPSGTAHAFAGGGSFAHRSAPSSTGHSQASRPQNHAPQVQSRNDHRTARPR